MLAALIRLPTLAQQSFWLDEAYTERLVRMSFGGMLHGVAQTESTPPVYYALAWGWTHIVGQDEFGLRSLSALAGIATVPVVYLAAERLAGRRAGVVAGLLVASSPLLVWFSQEARAYALAGLLAAATLLCLVAYLQDDRAGWLAGWAVCAALGLGTHYFVGFVVAAEVVLMVWRRRERWSGGLVVALAVVVVIAIALVPLALAQRGTGHADYIAQGSLSTRIAQVPKQLLIGYASPGQLATGLLAGLLVLGGAVPPLLRRRATLGRARLPLTIGIAAVIVPIGLALIGIDFLNTRNLLVALPALAVAAAVGFAAAMPRGLGVACAGGLALLGVVVVILVDTHDRYQRDDWRGVSHALGTSPGARAIVVSPGSGLIALQAYRSGLRTLTTPAAVTELDVVAVPQQVTGGGIGTPPRPVTPPALPAGFTLSKLVAAQTYTVLRYRAAAPVAITPMVAAADHLGPGSFTVLLQNSPGSG